MVEKNWLIPLKMFQCFNISPQNKKKRASVTNEEKEIKNERTIN